MQQRERDSLLAPGIRWKMKCQRRNETKRNEKQKSERRKMKEKENTDWNDD